MFQRYLHFHSMRVKVVVEKFLAILDPSCDISSQIPLTALSHYVSLAPHLNLPPRDWAVFEIYICWMYSMRYELSILHLTVCSCNNIVQLPINGFVLLSVTTARLILKMIRWTNTFFFQKYMRKVVCRYFHDNSKF